MDAVAYTCFAIVGFRTFLLVMSRQLLHEVGKFIKFCRRWKANVFPRVDNPG